MNNYTKKIISILLTLIILLPLIPAQTVMANMQNPVTDLIMTDLSDSRGTNYSAELWWTEPTVSETRDGAELLVGGAVELHRPTRYEIYYRNATKSERYTNPMTTTVNGQQSDSPEPYRTQLANLPLLKGSIYTFKVVPYHTNTFRDNATVEGTVSRRANQVTSGVTESENMYLTDITVTGEGRGNEITITWDYPTVDGRAVFEGYNVYYEVDIPDNEPVPTTKPHTVLTSDSNLIRTAEGKLQYTFTDNNLQQGMPYAVKVEPLYLGREVRKQTSPIITYNSKEYRIIFTQREYRTVEPVRINPKLTAEPEGTTYVRLSWDTSFIAKLGETVNRVDIYQSYDENMAPATLIGTIHGIDARSINYWKAEWPENNLVSYYQLFVYYPGSSEPMKSEIASFDPVYDEFTPYKPNVLSVTAGAKPINMVIQWQAFTRKAYNTEDKVAEEGKYGGKLIDRDIIYSIWVTDNADNLDDPAFESQVMKTYPGSRAITDIADTSDPSGQLRIPTYLSENIQQYVTKNPATGIYESRNMVDNKVYYIKIMAKRDPSGQTSQSATGSKYIPPEGDLDIKPYMISRPPLRIKTTAQGEEVTESSITIQWDKNWYEAYSTADNSWYPKAAIDDAGNILFGAEANKITDPSKIVMFNSAIFTESATGGSTAIKAELKSKGANSAAADALEFRAMNLNNAEYLIHVAEFDYVDALGGYEYYLMNNLMVVDPDTMTWYANAARWQPVTPTGGTDLHPELLVNFSHAPTPGFMVNNKAYVIYFLPYKYISQEAFYPSYVVGTTKNQRPGVDVKPTVPILQPVQENDMSLRVKWEFSPELQYEIRYSDNIADYSEGGTLIQWGPISGSEGFIEASDGTHRYYTIMGLFPETNYHIWIRAVSPNSSTPYSFWSNPITMTTKPLSPPSPPRGLGLASTEHISLYNKATGVDPQLKNINFDYMVIEWMKDFQDNSVEAATANTADGAEPLSIPGITNMYAVKFNDLVANRTYYIRAKTILTLTMAEAVLQRQYAYTVQMSPTEDFTDFVEITVPALADIGQNQAYTLRMESEWSTVIHYVTSPTDTEYDGDKNPAMYPLPVEDYEILYNNVNDTLTFRFRTNKKDASGANDNNVDQRFISKLIASRTFNYVVDLSKYENRSVTNRVLELPYSIFTAFQERKISLTVKADNLSVTIPPGALNTSEFKSIGNFGKDSTIKLTLSENPQGAPALKQDEKYISKPHKLTVQAVTAIRTVNLENFAVKSNVELKLDSRSASMESNVGAYVSDKDTVGWQRVSAEYNTVAGSMSIPANKMASFAAIAKNPVLYAADDGSVDAMYNLTSKINITDLGAYIPTSIITANQFNNLLAAVAKNSLVTEINSPLPDSDYQSLGKSKMLVSGTNVPREAGINALVKLYETKTRSTIKNYASLSETPYTDIASASSQYQASLLKAGELGLYGNAALANPKADMTLGEAIYILDIIIQDAGL